ncbi:MAG: PmoA family protein [Hamadaea sp.]|nr:PmoA family protein [Hamadaea sp.]
MGLRLIQSDDTLRILDGDQDLLTYVYRPGEAQLESPRPYFHPLRTRGGDLVSLYRPHDHVWHKGIALSLPNVGPANLWGGATYVRDRGYVQLPNNGSMVHTGFDRITPSPQGVRVEQRLDWVTQDGETWFREKRSFTVALSGPAGWTLDLTSDFTNVSASPVALGSPTTQGRENAGYGGVFWRGPRSFTGGVVTTVVDGELVSGGDELMGVRAPWMAFTGRHDEVDRASTLLFAVDKPVEWFVRTTPFACVCPAPYFSTETIVEPGGSAGLGCRVTVLDGPLDPTSIPL